MNLTAEQVTLAYAKRPILSEIGFEIRTGEFIGMLGPNGAGKTTLMRAVLGLLSPVAGQLRIDGKAAARGGHRIGYLPQTRLATPLLRLRGQDYLAASIDGEHWGVPHLTNAGRQDLAEALALVDATALATRPLGELSGGERQRLLIAQALLGRPGLLLLDEPLISLDPHHQHAILHLLRDLQQRLGLTILLSAHELNPLLPVIDRVLYLGAGRAALGTVDEVVTTPNLTRLYGAPIEVVHAAGRIFVIGADDAHAHHHA